MSASTSPCEAARLSCRKSSASASATRVSGRDGRNCAGDVRFVSPGRPCRDSRSETSCGTNVFAVFVVVSGGDGGNRRWRGPGELDNRMRLLSIAGCTIRTGISEYGGGNGPAGPVLAGSGLSRYFSKGESAAGGPSRMSMTIVPSAVANARA